jgi:hypothetical protein
LLAPRRERLSALFDQTLDVIEDAFEARKIFLVRGVVVDGGIDDYARLEAVKLFMLIFLHVGKGRPASLADSGNTSKRRRTPCPV